MLSKTNLVSNSLRRRFLQIRSGSSRTAMLSWYPHESNGDDFDGFTKEQIQETMLMMLQKPETSTGFVPSAEMHLSNTRSIIADDENKMDDFDGFTKEQIQEAMLMMLQKPETLTGFVPSAEMLSSNNDNAIPDEESNIDFGFTKEQIQEASMLLMLQKPETSTGFVPSAEMLSSNNDNAIPDEESNIDFGFTKEQIQEASMLLILQKPETSTGFVPSAEMLSCNASNATGDVDIATANQTTSDLLAMLSLASSPESAIGVNHCSEYLNAEMKKQMSTQYENSLPKTLSEALSDPRPIVVTSAASPFEVVDVNEAWVGLCGFSREEAKNRNLGQLLNGPETDVSLAREMVANLRREHYSRAILSNYTKTGRRFENRVQVGTLSSDNGESIEYFVGLLEEIPQAQQSM
ncbi:unnamed protein product [Cylindrotheca closterium]|uniref:PAS domain-containing protein n=1 Tax=Cylindrotheca closterium TaxID=2856 RepID=A0AAD2JJX8_9STRA|nr:unnamed protein product [Cylindrotheca closterium]